MRGLCVVALVLVASCQIFSGADASDSGAASDGLDWDASSFGSSEGRVLTWGHETGELENGILVVRVAGSRGGNTAVLRASYDGVELDVAVNNAFDDGNVVASIWSKWSCWGRRWRQSGVPIPTEA